MKALILRGQIVQVAAKEFVVHPDYQWVQCPDDCTTEWIYQDEVFIAPEPEKPFIDSQDVMNKKLNAIWHFCDTGDRSAIDAVKQEL
jgi:hypothetical protein